MDDLDRAKELEMQQRDIALRRTLQRPRPPQQQRDEQGRIICVDCAEPIPESRLAAKPDAARCIFCKLKTERKQQQYRRK